MKHRIAFAGASGTGKTWLATRLAEELTLPFCPIGSRQVAAEMGFANPYEVDQVPGKRLEFQSNLIRKKAFWENAHENFVSDRTVIDNLTYMALHDVHGIDEAMLKFVRDHFANYTHVIVCLRSGFSNLGEDYARILRESYQEVYEGCLLGLLDSFIAPNTHRLMLALSDPQERLTAVRRFLLETL